MTAFGATTTAPGVALQPGERVLWEGRPSVAYMFAPGWIVLLAILLPILVVVIVVSAIPQPRGAPPLLAIVILPLAIVAAVTVPIFLYIGRQVAATRYILTDRRAVIRGPYREAQIDLRHLGYVEIRRGFGGRATITFAPPAPYGRYVWYSGASFHSIEDADRVYALINEARARLNAV